MEEQDSQPVTPERPAASVVLTVDYSNGMTTTIAGVPLDDMGGLWATIAQPSLEHRHPPVNMAEGFVDRGGNHRTHIEAIGGVAIEPGENSWSIWVNEHSMGSDIRYHMAGLAGGRQAEPAVSDGDSVLIKLVAVEAES